jgi:hypothetical protein
VDPDIKVYTACPHNDFFGEWLTAVFGKGLAEFSDGICLHIYVGPEFIANFDNWWTKYMATVQEIETRHGKRFPLVVTEYGYDHKKNPERAGGFCLAATTAMLGTFKADLLTQFMFHAKEMRGDDAYAVFRGNFEDNVTVRTLRHLYGLFKGSEYRPLDGAWISPDGEYFQKPGVPSTPDTKFYAFDITKPDGSRLAYVAAWRGRWDYGQSKLLEIPDQDVTITVPGPYRSAEEIDTRTGELKEFKAYRAHKDGVSFTLSLSGIARGQEGWPRAFIFRR